MHLGNAIKMAFKSLKVSKMRTFLTMLGVIIGVLTVALLTTVADGATSSVINSLKKESTLSLILVQKETSIEKFDEVVSSVRANEEMGAFDYSVVVQNSANVNNGAKSVSTIVGYDQNGNPINSSYYKRSVLTKTTIYGIGLNFNEVRNLKVDGQWIEEANQVVVDSEFIEAFFGKNVASSSVIGQNITLGGVEQLKITGNAADIAEAENIYNAIKSTIVSTKYTTSVAEFNSATNYVDGKIVLYVSPNEFVAESTFITMIRGAVSSITSDETTLGSYSLVEIFDSTLAKNYIIVGVVSDEEQSFSLGSSNSDMKSSLSTMGTEFAALSEAIERSAKGKVYTLIDNENLNILSSTSVATKDELSIAGAYLRYEDENKVGDGNIRLMMAFMKEGYKIMKDIMPVSMDSVAAIINTSMNVLTIMLTVISSISLIVGGIGIMNIMLVAVSERTREIGIRKAIGAKRSSILTQFLVEALVVSLLGGAIGLTLSWIGSLIIGALMGIALPMPFWVIAMSLGFCVVIGVAFGMYPAIKASRLQPIDALRHD